ncbi:uncharacterized protein LOC106664434 [Cimex lectularius]|uniref:Uncharacterized protein n=1 Tax=Cimex lectularius TaxID=79782 RepID=A0A8I6RHT3_CIMLE|nr:uncharacterized protein LOC106664434 [Cimex lectularius]
MCDNAIKFRHLVNNDMDKVPRGFVMYDHQCLVKGEMEELESVFVDMCKSNEHYLATHKQVLGLISLLLHNVIKDQPFDPRKYIKSFLKDKDLKLELNRHMAEKGYEKNQSQLKHDKIYKKKVDSVHERIRDEEEGEIRKYLDHGKITLTSFGPPFPACHLPYAKSEISTILHGSIPVYDRPLNIIPPLTDPQRNPNEWPTFYY